MQVLVHTVLHTAKAPDIHARAREAPLLLLLYFFFFYFYNGLESDVLREANTHGLVLHSGLLEEQSLHFLCRSALLYMELTTYLCTIYWQKSPNKFAPQAGIE